MITYDNFPQSELENICEAENNAEVMRGFINETSKITDTAKRKEAILHSWSTYMNSFWDEGNDLISSLLRWRGGGRIVYFAISIVIYIYE